MSNTNLLTDAKVGDGVTYGAGSDCYPGTVVRRTAKTITVQHDSHKPAAGYDYYANQVYDYSPNPNGATFVARWSEKRQGFVYCDRKVHVGHRRYYQDPSF